MKKKIINKSYKKIKILGTGNITSKLDIVADFSSKSAKDKIEKMKSADITISKSPADIGQTLYEKLNS